MTKQNLAHHRNEVASYGQNRFKSGLYNAQELRQKVLQVFDAESADYYADSQYR